MTYGFQLHQAGGQAGHFNASRSSTFRDTLRPFEASYGTGAGSGTIGSDNVVVAGLPVHTQFFGKPTTPENTTRFKLVPTFALTGAVTDVEGDLNGRLQLELWV